MYESWDTVTVAMTRRLRLRHLSYRTEVAYLGWLSRFQDFTGSRLGVELRAGDVVRSPLDTPSITTPEVPFA